MTDRLLLWYRARTQREQRLVLAGGVIAVLAFAYLLIVPLSDLLESERGRHATDVIALGETQVRIDAVKAAQAERIAPLDAPLETVIRSRANDAGFALAAVTPQGNDRVAISIGSARPGALTGWVAELEASGVLVEQLTTTDNGDRTVGAQMTLRARGQ
jgi:general secretion pathway protein M